MTLSASDKASPTLFSIDIKVVVSAGSDRIEGGLVVLGELLMVVLEEPVIPRVGFFSVGADEDN